MNHLNLRRSYEYEVLSPLRLLVESQVCFEAQAKKLSSHLRAVALKAL